MTIHQLTMLFGTWLKDAFLRTDVCCQATAGLCLSFRCSAALTDLVCPLVMAHVHSQATHALTG